MAVGAATAWVEAGEACPDETTRGESVEAGVMAGSVRVEAQWSRWDTPYGEERSLSVSAPPRYVDWHEDAYGCAIAVGVAGATTLPCVAGGPPAPPVG